jgi:alpha-1,2-mannosyltransferase
MSERIGTTEAVRLGGARVRVWALGLFVMGVVPVVGAPSNHWHDWGAIWAAGATVGGPDLVDAGRHVAWQAAHGVSQAFWAYPPAAAWLFWPLARLPVEVSFWVQGLLMLGCIAAAGVVAARVYGLTPELAVLAALAWAPSTASIVIGQNAPLALLAAMVAIWALATDRPWVAGLAAALLWYKPTLALGFVGLFLVRGRWRELAVTLAGAGAAFLLSVAAAGGDWSWLGTWLDGARTWLPADAAGNADKAISLPGLLGRLPVPWPVPVLGGVALAVAAIPGLRRAGIVEAASGACLVGLAAGPRSWGYDAALAFPFVCWILAGGVGEPWRTRVVVAAYLGALLWMFSWATQLSAVAVIVLAAAAWWIWRWRPWAAPATAQPAEASERAALAAAG